MANQVGVVLNVPNLEKSLEFYKGLGMKVDEEHKGEDGKVTYVDLSIGGAELGIVSFDAAGDDEEFRQWVSTPLGAGVMIILNVDDVDAIAKKAKGVGATIENGPEDRPYGRIVTLNDPDGYVVSFLKPKA